MSRTKTTTMPASPNTWNDEALDQAESSASGFTKFHRFKPFAAQMRAPILVAILLCACVGAPGCTSHGGVLGVDCCSDIPAGAIPAKPGSKVCGIQRAQVMAANVDQYVLYQADFVGQTAQLSPAAADRIARFNAAGSLDAETLRIESSNNASLDQLRVAAVSTKLSENGIANAQVVVAVPAALGLTGTFAENSLGGTSRSQGNSSRSSGRGIGISGGTF